MKLTGITTLLNVEDVPRSLGFYRDVLGFTVEAEFATENELVWVRLSHGPVALMLNRSPSRKRRGSRSAADSYDDALLCIMVDDLDAVWQTLEAARAAPKPVETESYGLREFTVRDPDGYELAFQQPIASADST